MEDPRSHTAIRNNPRPSSPPWDSHRSYLTGSFLQQSSTIDSTPLSTYPQNVQHHLATEDALHALLGVRSSYAIVTASPPPSAAPDAPSTPTYALAKDKLIDAHPEIAPLLSRILPLATHHAAVKTFIEHTRLPHPNSGHVRQAVGAALSTLLIDYNSFILRLESASIRNTLTLQKLLYYVQPSARSMSLLAAVARACTPRRGGAALHAVYTLAISHVGADDAKQVLAFIVEQAAAPILDMMYLWIRTGVIHDPYSEFFILEDRSLKDTAPAATKLWNMRYSINWDNLPDFLAPFVEKVLRAGKYINVLAECGVDTENVLKQASRRLIREKAIGEKKPPMMAAEHNNEQTENDMQVVNVDTESNTHDNDPIYVRLSGKVLLSPDASRRIAQVVDKAFEVSSTALMSHLEKVVCIRERLRSLRRFFLLEQCDYLVHFFDAAAAELRKPRKDVSRSKLSSLLEISIRSSVSANDPFQDDLTCVLCVEDLAKQITEVVGNDKAGMGRSEKTTTNDEDITGYEAFALDYTAEWPVNLIVTEMEVLKYQFLFRYLFYCKHTERELKECWRYQSQSKGALKNMANSFVRSYALRNRMLQFIRNMLYYTVAHVIEPNWRSLESAIRQAGTIDEIMQHHSTFLDLSISQCLLANDKHIRVFKRIAQTCIAFARYTERFNDLFISGESGEEVEKHLQERNYPAMLARFETSFDTHLGKLLDGLSAVSKKRANVHLATLCDTLDVGGYYGRSKERALASFGALEI